MKCFWNPICELFALSVSGCKNGSSNSGSLVHERMCKETFFRDGNVHPFIFEGVLIIGL